MRSAILFCILGLVCSPVQAQDFFVEQSAPAHGDADVPLADTVAFSFNKQVGISTDFNTEFVYRPSDSLAFDEVSLCLTFLGVCDAGDDIPRHVRYQVDHQPNTDYTWLVYGVQTVDGDSMSAPYTLRYTTASEIGQGTVSGSVAAPVPMASRPAAARKQGARSSATRTSLRKLARGLRRSNLGRPVFETPDTLGTGPTAVEGPGAAANRPKTQFKTVGRKAASEGPYTQVLLVDEFSIDEDTWSVRAGDALIGSSGTYSLDFVRSGSYVPIAVRYTDGTSTKIDALGFHDPDGDGSPNAVTVDGDQRTGIDLQLFEFPRTTARAAENLPVAVDSADQYAPDQELRWIEAENGIDPSGTAFEWTYRFYSPSKRLETEITINPLAVTVDTSEAIGFLTDMDPMPDGFIDSDAALDTALANGGQEFVDQYPPRNLTTFVSGGNLFWTDPPDATAEFWRVRFIGVSGSTVETFERYIRLEGAAEAPQFATSVAPQNAIIESGKPGTIEQTIKNESGEAGPLEVKITDVPGFLALMGAEGGAFAPSDSTLTLGPGESEVLTYSFDKTVESTTTFDGEISHETNDPDAPTVGLPVAVTARPPGLAVEITKRFGDASGPGDYRLVALPGQADRPLSASISGEAGSEWQAFWDDGTEADFLVRFDGSETFRFGPGRGLWLTATEEWSVQDSIETVSLKRGPVASVPLHDGWNIVSNPLGRDVSWEAVDQANGGGLQPVWAFGESFAQADTFRSARTGRAYYFLNDGGLDSLSVPVPRSTTSRQSALAAGASPSGSERSSPGAMRLVATRDDSLRSSVRMGIAGRGRGDASPRDAIAPPTRFSELSLRLAASGNESSRRRFLATEYRSPENGANRNGANRGHTFDLRLESETEGAVQLTASNLEALEGREALLIEDATGKSHDLRAGRTVTIEAADSTALRLAVGTADFVEKKREAALPREVNLTTYPNPMRKQATLEYTLPEATDVRIAVYDVLGRQVALLEDARKEAGRHTLSFGGTTLSSGTYFGRLSTGDQTYTQKITVVR